MAWLSSFLLGIPGQEYSFDVSPATMQLSEGPNIIVNKNIMGYLRKAIINQYSATAKISGSYLTLAQRQTFLSFCSMPDVFFSFRTRDNWTRLEKAAPSNSGTTITLDTNAITLLDQTLAIESYTTQITILGVYDNFAMSGTNYYTGGSFNASTSQITLGTTLAADFGYVNYQYQGFLCNVETIDTTSEGGWMDKFQYDFQITGV